MGEETQEKIEAVKARLTPTETQELYHQAEKLFTSPLGQKVLRELEAMDVATHGMSEWIDNEHTYAGDDYEDDSEKFTITNYREAIYIPKIDCLFLTDDPFAPDGALEERMKREIHDWWDVKDELDDVPGQFAAVKGYGLKLFTRRYWGALSERTKIATAKGLFERGILFLEYWEEKHKFKEGEDPEYQRYLKMPFEKKLKFLDKLKKEGKKLPRPPIKFGYRLIHV